MKVVICRALYLLAPLLMGLIPPDAHGAPRDRPKIRRDTLVTDNGVRLRGAAFNIKVAPLGPTKWANNNEKAQFRTYFKQNASKYKLNTVRIACFYQKGDDMKPWTYEAELNAAKQWAKSLDMYVIINLHTTDTQPIPVDEAKKFWNYYAPKHKNDPHVIFELVNEPDNNDPDQLKSMNKLRNFVRGKAPQTHLILYSFYNMKPSRARALISNPDFKAPGNTSVAFHSYVKFDERWNGALILQNNGYPIINTELQATTRVDPRTLSFFALGQNLVRAQKYDVSWIAWQPNLSLAIRDEYQFSGNNYGNGLCNFRSPNFTQKKVNIWFPFNCP